MGISRVHCSWSSCQCFPFYPPWILLSNFPVAVWANHYRAQLERKNSTILTIGLVLRNVWIVIREEKQRSLEMSIWLFIHISMVRFLNFNVHIFLFKALHFVFFTLFWWWDLYLFKGFSHQKGCTLYRIFFFSPQVQGQFCEEMFGLSFGIFREGQSFHSWKNPRHGGEKLEKKLKMNNRRSR